MRSGDGGTRRRSDKLAVVSLRKNKQAGPNPLGLCMCGCDRKTKIATKSDRRHGHVMGHLFDLFIATVAPPRRVQTDTNFVAVQRLSS